MKPVPLPFLQESTRLEKSNMFQKELQNKEHEFEKILYRQKKVTEACFSSFLNYSQSYHSVKG